LRAKPVLPSSAEAGIPAITAGQGKGFKEEITMSKLLVKPASPDANGTVTRVTPESAGWTYVGFALHRLADGQRFDGETGDKEICIVAVTGTISVMAGGERFERIGGRKTVFDGATSSVYVPNGEMYEVVAHGAAEVAICSAPGAGNHKVRLIGPADVGFEERGQGSNRRLVYNILPEGKPADSLLIVEVVTPAGNWSSYPPHKHDQDDLPRESFLEETYYHRLNPSQGFAFQRVYTDDRSLDETMAVSDGDVVLVPRGYHPVGAAHGYDLYYLNVMAGPHRVWKFHNDPAHEWMLKR
jgi:5-deoxy-glucuronate isomerase